MDTKDIDTKIDDAAETAKKLLAKLDEKRANIAATARDAVKDAESLFVQSAEKGQHRLSETIVKAAHRIEELANEIAHRTEEVAHKISNQADATSDKADRRSRNWLDEP